MTSKLTLKGIPASEGLATGPAFYLDMAPASTRKPGTPAEEASLLRTAISTAHSELTAIAHNAEQIGADILEFQQALLEDTDLIDPIFSSIENGVSADQAWVCVLDTEIATYQAAEDEYMAARSVDLLDTRSRVLSHLTGTPAKLPVISPGAILIAKDLTPSRFLEIDWTRAAGLIVTDGSPTSHVAILARARGIPMVISRKPLAHITAGDIILLDAHMGRIAVSPDNEALEAFEARRAKGSLEAKDLARLALEPAQTADGTRISVMINVEDPRLLDDLDPATCDGIGLTRTEFLFEGGAPCEEKQFRMYSRIIRWAAGKPVTIRTLDAGGDKPIRGITIDGESNPYLGMRGVRLSLAKPEYLRVQLRALCRAAALGDVKIMIPMVSIPEELQAVRDHLDAVINDLINEKIPHARPALGIMVETPAAALAVRHFDADFFSIGSNDLTQYVMAAARDNVTLMHLSNSQSPVMFELIARIINDGRSLGAGVCLCGDLASQVRHIEKLIRAGLRTLSVAPAQIGRIKQAISQVTVS